VADLSGTQTTDLVGNAGLRINQRAKAGIAVHSLTTTGTPWVATTAGDPLLHRRALLAQKLAQLAVAYSETSSPLSSSMSIRAEAAGVEDRRGTTAWVSSKTLPRSKVEAIDWAT